MSRIFPVDISKQMAEALQYIERGSNNEDEEEEVEEEEEDELLDVTISLSRAAALLSDTETYEREGPGCFYLNDNIVLKSTEDEGYGWYAKDSIPEGTLLLSELPLAHIYDIDMDAARELVVEEEDNDDEIESKEQQPTESELLTQVIITDAETRDNGWEYWKEKLDQLHPRRAEYNSTNPDVIHEKCRLNILGFETCPEMVTYQQVFADLSGIGLYAKASGFNHSCTPNVNRFAVGTCQHFVTNRDITPGEQLTISYFEHEYLSSNIMIRRKQLEGRDFICKCDRCVIEEDKWEDNGDDTIRGVDMDTIPEDLNDSLAIATPSERINMCTKLLDNSFNPISDIKDKQVLGTKALIEVLIWLAVSHLQLHNYSKSDEAWTAAYNTALKYMPPNDESLALCLMHRTANNLFNKDYSTANELARHFVRQHSMTFGKSYKLIRLRYSLEVTYIAQTSLDTTNGADERDLNKRVNLIWDTFKRAWLSSTM